MEVIQPNHIKEEQDLTFTCEICIEPVHQSGRFENKETCAHDSYCVTCIARYIEAQTEEHNTGDIKCPGLNCENFLDPLHCQSILQPRVFERWCDALCESWILRLRYKRGQCPYSDCLTMYLTDCMYLNMITCVKCKKKFCYECRIAMTKKGDHDCQMHRGMEDENDARVARLAIENRWKRCPRCGFIVEKLSGCEHMICRCGTQFDYHSGMVEIPMRCTCAACRRKFVAFLLCLFVFFCCLSGLWFWGMVN